MNDDSRKSGSRQTPGARRAGLGRGLEALIPTLESSTKGTPSSVSTALVSSISPNPRQPRTSIDEQELELLAESIRQHGIIQPVVVTPSGTPDRLTLIAGERRWRAAKLAGLREIPVVVLDVSEQAQLELALVENVIRADLSPLEEAAAYRQLVEEFGLTQAEVGDRVGRSRVSVTNTLRLLLLPERVKDALDAKIISEGHARALLGLPSTIDQLALLEAIIERGWSVRETENAVRKSLEQQADTRRPLPSTPLWAEHADFEQRLRRALATNVTINRSERGSGSIRIEFSSDEQFAQLLDLIAGESLY